MSINKDEILKYFARYIERELGIIYSEHNYFQLQCRLEDMARFQNLPGIEEVYKGALQSLDHRFQQYLLDLATNNETSFFRDPKVFKAIQEILETRMPLKENPYRIWSAAASSGQEALSIAMTLAELAQKNTVFSRYQIVATDVSDRILEKAKSATYTQLEVQRGLPIPMLVKYFAKNENDTWKANFILQKTINYKKMNLLDPFSFSGGEAFDMILCRNMLIYQSVERKQEIVAKLIRALTPDGILILGSGETLIGLSEECDQLEIKGAIIYQKKGQQGLKKVA